MSGKDLEHYLTHKIGPGGEKFTAGHSTSRNEAGKRAADLRRPVHITSPLITEGDARSKAVNKAVKPIKRSHVHNTNSGIPPIISVLRHMKGLPEEVE